MGNIVTLNGNMCSLPYPVNTRCQYNVGQRWVDVVTALSVHWLGYIRIEKAGRSNTLNTFKTQYLVFLQ